MSFDRKIRLKYVADIRISNIDKKSAEDQVSVRLCNYLDVYYNDTILDTFTFAPATATPEQIQEFLLRAGDILITKDSETAGDIAVPAFNRVSATDVVCGYHLALVRPYEDLIDGRYLFWSLKATNARDQFSAAATGVTRFGLREDAIGNVELVLPELDQQRTIAAFLDSEIARIDALVAKKSRIAKLIIERFDVMIRSTLANPRWSTLPIKRRWTVIDCKHHTPNYVEEGFPVVGPGDMTPGRLDLSQCHRFVTKSDFADLIAGGRRPKRGDIVYSRNASVGIASYVDTDRPFCMGQDVCLITSGNQDQRFLSYCLNTLGADQLELARVGSTFTRINVDQIVELRVPVPAQDEQRAVADHLDEVKGKTDAIVEGLRRQIVLLQEHRQALTTAAVTGQIDVTTARRRSS